jgi:hypothetical protein
MIVSSAPVKEIAPGVHRWTARHPEWHTRAEWGRKVAGYALETDDTLSLVDPLLPDEATGERQGVLAAIERLASLAGRVEILITVPYHTRSAEELYARLAPRIETTLWGHQAVGKRLSGQTPLTAIVPGELAGTVARALPIGKPRRFETPLYFAAQRALAFGDALVVVDGALRVWLAAEPRNPAWYRGEFVPTLEPLLDLDTDLILATHGEAIVADGRRALAEALSGPPFVA